MPGKLRKAASLATSSARYKPRLSMPSGVGRAGIFVKSGTWLNACSSRKAGLVTLRSVQLTKHRKHVTTEEDRATQLEFLELADRVLIESLWLPSKQDMFGAEISQSVEQVRAVVRISLVGPADANGNGVLAVAWFGGGQVD